MDRLAEREPEPEPFGRLIAGVPRRAQMAIFAQDEPDESRAVLGVVQALRRQTGRAGSGCFRRGRCTRCRATMIRAALALTSVRPRVERPATSPPSSRAHPGRARLEEAHRPKGEKMSVEEILGTHRRPLIADVATLAACIDGCVACAATCTICADACLAEPDIEALARCIRLCLDCADACVDAGRILCRQTDPDADTQLTALKACLAACRACAAECERHAHHHEHCRLSAKECRRCERACDDLLAALGVA
jgi:hypothetical protein